MKQKSFTSLEQKAKAYDEAIKRAKSAIKECGNNQGRIAMIESIFPELKESEDDRIRKALIRFHKSTIDIDGIKGDEIVAWLEKQSEQKPSNKVEPKFKVGDWITDGNNALLCVEKFEIDYGYELKATDGQIFHFVSPNLVDANYHLWTIQDAKDGDVLCTYECCKPKIVFILKGTPKKHYALSYHCYYNIMYPHFASDSEKGCLAPNDEDVKPATKEQRDLLFQKMHESGYEWDAEKKELKKIEQKPAWSEEDEYILLHTINDLKFLKDDISIDPKYAINIIDIGREIDWLKSLKDRYTWKPSE